MFTSTHSRLGVPELKFEYAVRRFRFSASGSFLILVSRCCFVAFCLANMMACRDRAGNADVRAKDTVQSRTDSAVSTIKRAAPPVTGLEMEPDIQKTDSLEVLFFDNPDGDSLRYTRFYRYVTSKEPELRNLIFSHLEQRFIKEEAIRNCRSEGKVFMYHGPDPVKTLYFSTRGDSCSYLYMISNGEFLYFPLSDSLSNRLGSLKKIAKKP